MLNPLLQMLRLLFFSIVAFTGLVIYIQDYSVYVEDNLLEPLYVLNGRTFDLSLKKQETGCV